MTASETHRINEEALGQIFRNARTFSGWRSELVPVEVLKEIYALARLGPTSANSSPARFVFLTTPEAKARLLPVLSSGNVEKTRAAPVNVIVAWDTEFYEKLPRLFPQKDMRAIFAGKQTLIDETAMRNSSLEGGYFILAARALGLDCGPMSGFDAAKVNAEFFPDGTWKVNFLCNLGYGDRTVLHPRNPRLDFEESCEVLVLNCWVTATKLTRCFSKMLSMRVKSSNERLRRSTLYTMTQSSLPASTAWSSLPRAGRSMFAPVKPPSSYNSGNAIQPSRR
jgi:3-hydroxypropanoate dehydrogenase